MSVSVDSGIAFLRNQPSANPVRVELFDRTTSRKVIAALPIDLASKLCCELRRSIKRARQAVKRRTPNRAA